MTVETSLKCAACDGLTYRPDIAGRYRVCNRCHGAGFISVSRNVLSPVPPPGVATDKQPMREIVLTGQGVRVQMRGICGEGLVMDFSSVLAVGAMMEQRIPARLEIDGEEYPGCFLITRVETRPFQGRWEFDAVQVHVTEEVAT